MCLTAICFVNSGFVSATNNSHLKSYGNVSKMQEYTRIYVRSSVAQVFMGILSTKFHPLALYRGRHKLQNKKCETIVDIYL